MKPGDIYILVDNPVSRTVEGHGGETVAIVRVGRHSVEIQLQDMGPVGRRLVLRQDLVRGGQLQLL